VTEFTVLPNEVVSLLLRATKELLPADGLPIQFMTITNMKPMVSLSHSSCGHTASETHMRDAASIFRASLDVLPSSTVPDISWGQWLPVTQNVSTPQGRFNQ